MGRQRAVWEPRLDRLDEARDGHLANGMEAGPAKSPTRRSELLGEPLTAGRDGPIVAPTRPSGREAVQ